MIAWGILLKKGEIQNGKNKETVGVIFSLDAMYPNITNKYIISKKHPRGSPFKIEYVIKYKYSCE